MRLTRTTKGIDDVLAMLLALSAKPEELDVLMLSLTFGNVEVQKYVFCDSFRSLPICSAPTLSKISYFRAGKNIGY